MGHGLVTTDSARRPVRGPAVWVEVPTQELIAVARPALAELVDTLRVAPFRQTARSTAQLLLPPNPNELEIATRTRASRAACGT